MFSKDNTGKGAAPTIISTDLTIGGDLTSEGEIQIDGHIDGDVRCKTLSIGETGMIAGSVTADHLLVRGRIEGQIRAKMVSLTQTAQVMGDVFHETLCIESGAQLEGHCRRLNTLEGADDADLNLNLIVEDSSVHTLKPGNS